MVPVKTVSFKSCWYAAISPPSYYGSLSFPGSEGSLKEEWMKTRPMQLTGLCVWRKRKRDAPCDTSAFLPRCLLRLYYL
jgi:hypothetical protein